MSRLDPFLKNLTPKIMLSATEINIAKDYEWHWILFCAIQVGLKIAGKVFNRHPRRPAIWFLRPVCIWIKNNVQMFTNNGRSQFCTGSSSGDISGFKTDIDPTSSLQLDYYLLNSY